MEFERFFKFSQLLLRDEFVLSYSGYVSEDILEAVGDTLRQRLENHARDGPQPGPADSEKPSFGIVMVSENNGTMDVIAGNFVSNDEAAMLQQKMAFLRDKTREELRGLYRQQLRDTPDGRSKGASLGLIEIARRSTLPINFEFTRTSDDLSFFMIRATV